MRNYVEHSLDVFIDLTATDGVTHRRRGDAEWPHPERFTARARQVICVVRPGTWKHLFQPASAMGWHVMSSASAIGHCSEAMAWAGSGQASLLVLQGPVDASEEALFALRHCLVLDPMFGWAISRISCDRGCCFRTLSKHGLGNGHWIPRRMLAEVREAEVAAEVFSPGLLIAPEVVGEFGALDPRFTSLAAALVYNLSRARRCGFRTVVANRAVMSIRGVGCDSADPPPIVPQKDRLLLGRMVPDLERGWEEFRAGSNERFETLSGHAFRAAAGAASRSLLLDIRNVGTFLNGTTRAVLGSLRALRRLSPAWNIEVLANPTAVKFHNLADLCDGWSLHTALPAGPFTAALRLSQPWHIQEIVDLHRIALVNVYFMLDTISWDVVYAAPAHHDGTWSFLADHADGFLFDSAFTERRFVARFERARRTPSAVCHYPFDPADYVLADVRRTSTSDYILIVGNELDHKDVLRTVTLLSEAFPFQSLVVLGPQLEESRRLCVYRAGTVLEAEIHRLYAEARFIVFPSFYEGFGFPLVKALAYDKTLIARRSELLEEIAGRCSTGRLVAFTRRDELVGILGKLLHGEPVQEVPLGTAVSGRPRNWQDVAHDITAFLDSLVRQPAGYRWLERERAVGQLLAFRT